MKFISFFIVLMYCLIPSVHAAENNPVTFHVSYDNFDFLADDFVYEAKKKNPEDRGLQLVGGRFGKALHISEGPPVNTDMSTFDLDMITALVIDNFYGSGSGRLYKDPYFWGAGKIHPACGAVSFWVKAVADSGAVFEQTTTSWGRTEKQLIEIVLENDGSLTAYVEDARYVQHTIHSKSVWKSDSWNHIVFMWDKSSGVELWHNGIKAASSMGNDAWWENQRPGLFHCGKPFAVYDELYTFNRVLFPEEIKNLFIHNNPPQKKHEITGNRDRKLIERLKEAYISDTSNLPRVNANDETTLVIHEITPEKIHDENIPGWWLADGRYECAWPHEYTIFTVIPGDVDYHAEKAEILPPLSADINYITFEGNLDGVELLKGSREGLFENHPAFTVPRTDSFFHGAMVDGLGNSGLCIPFTKRYGVPKYFNSDVLKLPLSGDLRIHEVGIYSVTAQTLPVLPGDRKFAVSAHSPVFDDSRYPLSLNSLLSEPDRSVAGLFETDTAGIESSPIELSPMKYMNLLSEPVVGKSAFDHLILDLWITSPTENNVLTVRLLDPAVPSHTWTHAEALLDGYSVEPSGMRLALRFDPVFLTSGDRIWIQLFATDGLSILTGNSERPSVVFTRPVTDYTSALLPYSYKTMRPAILTWGRMFEFIPWDYGMPLPNVDAPINFGGPFDTSYPWQAVLKVNPGDRIANIYRAFGTNEYTKGRHPADLSKVKLRTFSAPPNAPDWAVYFREFQTFRNRIINWWRHHQRSDGQVGGGWNDDVLLFGKNTQGYGDLPLDSNPGALALYNRIFDGFDKTDFYKDGYCRVWPTDQGHNGDFVRDRYKSPIYNLGDPRSAVWAMQEAWHWGKPDQTPVNYGDGSSFLFGKDVIEWYWNKSPVKEPYTADRDDLTDILRTAACVHNDTTYWRYTDAFNHIDDQRPYGGHVMCDVLNGGMAEVHRGNWKKTQTMLTITVGVGWIEGGGPELARLVEYSGNDGLTISMYSFDTFDRNVIARLFRLDSGLYRITLRADKNGDSEYETVLKEYKKYIRRFDRLNVTVPPKIPVILEIVQLKSNPEPSELPDLATSYYNIKWENGSLVATVFNIGTGSSGPFSVKLFNSQNALIESVRIESLDGASDFEPKSVDVAFHGVSGNDNYRIVLDYEEKIREIFEENNIVEIKRSF